MIKPEQYMPTIIILINAVSGIIYLCQGNIRKFLYFMFAAGPTITITY